MVVVAHKWIRNLANSNGNGRLPEPVNDNGALEDLANYVKDSGAYASAEYQSAGTRMWWLP